MALPDWILGVLLRPGETYERARTEMTYSYLWILLSVFTVEAVLLVYGPAIRSAVPAPSATEIIVNWAFFLMSVFAVQCFCLLGAGRLCGWTLSWPEAAKVVGLTWALYLVEDLVTFYPFLTDQEALVFWLSLPFLLWRIAAQTAGVRRLSGQPLWRSLLIVLLATLPWQGPLLYLSWLSAFHPTL